MRKICTFFLVCYCCLSLSACGVKGPLYEPQPEQPTQQQNNTK